MFVDEIEVDVIAGAGGDGCIAFRREKYVAYGGPFGGNGGKGSDIIFKADNGLNTLIDFRHQRKIFGLRGEHGSGKGKHGRGADDIVIKVPVGTIITDVDNDLIIADLTKEGEEVIVAKGGRGGRGNMAFATNNNPAPSIAENGEPGEARLIRVELKMLADVGLVGLPSVGKSTIISKISAAKPKIADYHFTTLHPNLGVVTTATNDSFVLADLPGLIKGASQGEGLGDRFLKHIERTRLIAHVIDMASFENRDPYEDYVLINEELKNYSEKLVAKPQIIIANKMDIPGAKQKLETFKTKIDKPIFEISAINDEGLNDLIEGIAKMLVTIEKQPLHDEERFESHVLYKFSEAEPFNISKDGNTWVIRGAEIEKLVKMTNFTSDEAMTRFTYKLRKLGIDEQLKKLGAQNGDLVRILDFEFEYTD